MSKAAHWTAEQTFKLTQALREGLTIREASTICGRDYDACLSKAYALKVNFSKRIYQRDAQAPSPLNLFVLDAAERRMMEAATEAHVAAVLSERPGGFQRPVRRPA